MHLDLSEQVSLVKLPVSGTIPSWVRGSLLRNGPIRYHLDNKAPEHWFDGLAMLHAFHMQDGQVTYSNKFVKSEAFKQVTQKESMDYLGFATDPCCNLFKRWISLFSDSSSTIQNANVNIVKIAKDYVALTETPLPVKFHPVTLETLGVLNYKDSLPHSNCFESAHPHNVDQEYINYLVNFGLNTTYQIYRLQGHHRDVIAEIPVDRPSYMHTFAVTPNFIVLTEYPLVVNPLSFFLKNKPFIKNYYWDPKRQTNFMVIDRKTGKVVQNAKMRPFFTFHHVNAYEEDNQLVMDMITYPDASIVMNVGLYDVSKAEYLVNESLGQARLRRYRINLRSGAISSEKIVDDAFELPRINAKYDGKPYRYLYGADIREKVNEHDERSLLRIDLKHRTVQRWSEANCYPGEPVFIPHPHGTEEEDGVIASIVEDTAKKQSFLLLLGASNFREVARAEVPFTIPMGLHGNFYP